MNSGLSQN